MPKTANEAIRAAMALLDANDINEPRQWVFTRPEARVLFGAEAIEGLPDNQIVRICGEHCYLVGEKWPMVQGKRKRSEKVD